MSEMKLALRDHRTSYRPGDEILGAAGWKASTPLRSVEVRLAWRTEGKGTPDTEVAGRVVFEHPQSEEARPFRLVAPAFPYSFSGKLISLVWSVELVLVPGGESQRVDLVIAPDRQEVLLDPVRALLRTGHAGT